MKLIKFFTLAIFLASQNILTASSAYAATYTITLDNKNADCTSFCTTAVGSTVAAAANTCSFTTTDKSGIIVGKEGTQSYSCPASSLDIAGGVAACTNACQTYKNDVGFNLGSLDAVANISSNTFSRAICNAFRIANGGAGKTFASFAVIATGIGFFTGKVSWGLMIGVAAGIATMFGASSIVAAISGESVNTMCDINTK